jgi:hypothetical protein
MIAGISMAVFGLVFLGFAFYMVHGVRKLSRLGVRTQAQVIGYELGSPDSDGKRSEYPKIQFTDTLGRQLTVVLTQTTELPIPGLMFGPGQSVPILYDPHQPHNVQVDTFFSKWLGPILAGVVGLGLFIAGIIMSLI